MIRVLVVDDERHTREGIAADVPWEALGMECVGLAADGVEALALMESARPHILLCDVRMPRMDGIELSARARQADDLLQIVFLSGYSDKEYLMSAIRVGAVDYVEKPVDTSELVDALVTARDRRMRAGDSADTAILALPADSDSGDAALRSRALASLSGPFLIALVLVHPDDREAEKRSLIEGARECLCALSPGLHHVAATYNDQVALLLSSGPEPVGPATSHSQPLRDLPAAILESLDTRVAVLVGPVARTLQEVPEAAEAAASLRPRVFYKGYGRTYWFKRRTPGTSAPAEAIREQLFHALRAPSGLEAGDARRIERLVFDMVRRLGETEPTDVQAVRGLLSAVATEIDLAFRSPMLHEDCVPLWQRAATAACLDEIESALIRTVREGFERWARIHALSPPVYRAVRLIRSEPGADLSVSRLANEAGVTPNHLSTLFRRKMGCTVGDYVANARIEKAKEILQTSAGTIAEVAHAVGYVEVGYFSRVFKRIAGCTPTEFRSRFS